AVALVLPEAPADAVAVGVDEREVAVAYQLLQLLGAFELLELRLRAQQTRDVDGGAVFGAPRGLVPLRDVERDGRALIALFDDGRREPAPGPLAGREHRQLGREMHLTLGARLAVDRDAEAQARQVRAQKLPGGVSEGLGAARELCLEVPTVARDDAVLRVGGGIIMVLQRIVRIGTPVCLVVWGERPAAPGLSRQPRQRDAQGLAEQGVC